MSSETTRILTAISDGDRSELNRLIELTYDDFRRLAKSYLADDARNNTLQPTAVVHEVFVKLVDHEDIDWRGRSHFFALGATAMRQILVDHARRKSADKRGGGRTRISLDERLTVSVDKAEDVLALDDALDKLAAINEQRARIVEMRFYAGMKLEEIASVLDVSVSTVKRQWAATSSWLRAELATTD